MKAIFICQNVDQRTAQEISLSEYMSKIGWEVLIYETKINNPNKEIKTITQGFDLVIFDTSKENGFNPNVLNGPNDIYKQIVFTI